jgi:phage-related protein
VKEGARTDKPIVWISGQLKTPPMSREARVEGGWLLRRVQAGEKLSMPESRPLPVIDPRCHELRIDDIERKTEWRVVYYVGNLAVAVLEIFAKKTRATPVDVVEKCRRRLADFKRRDAP